LLHSLPIDLNLAKPCDFAASPWRGTTAGAAVSGTSMTTIGTLPDALGLPTAPTVLDVVAASWDPQKSTLVGRLVP
jgi:hypothetical protein